MEVGCGALQKDKKRLGNGKYQSVVMWRTEKKKQEKKGKNTNKESGGGI